MKTLIKHRLAVLAWVVLAVIVSLCGFTLPQKSAGAQAKYCADLYEGGSEKETTTYTIECDYVKQNDDYHLYRAPNYGTCGMSVTNSCTAMAGANVIGFYDRYYPNLMPDFDPGFVVRDIYFYYPDTQDAVKTMFNKLYSYMNVNVNGAGATEAEVKAGLTRYINEQGYKVNYTSFYQNKTTVNVQKVKDMFNAKKVGLLFLDTYNFVYSFYESSSGARTVYQVTSPNSHVMIVYGYIKVDYYKNNQVFLTENFLEVTSCYSTRDHGYIKLGEGLSIDDAIIVNIA